MQREWYQLQSMRNDMSHMNIKFGIDWRDRFAYGQRLLTVRVATCSGEDGRAVRRAAKSMRLWHSVLGAGKRDTCDRRRRGHRGEVRVAHALRLRTHSRLVLAFVGFPKYDNSI